MATWMLSAAGPSTATSASASASASAAAAAAANGTSGGAAGEGVNGEGVNGEAHAAMVLTLRQTLSAYNEASAGGRDEFGE